MTQTLIAFNQIDGDHISLRDYGAVLDGVADDTLPFQAAINAAQSSGKALYLNSGTAKITSTLTITSSFFKMFSDYRERFILDAGNLTDASSAIKLQSDPSTTSISEVSIMGLKILGKDTATGAAIEIHDIAHGQFRDIVIEDYSAASTCRGIWTKGRQTAIFEDIRMKDVRTCFYIDNNPNASTIDSDHFVFRNCALNVSNITQGVGWYFKGTNNGNVEWDGFQSVGVALHAILVDNESTTSDSFNFNIQNLRLEQGNTTSIRSSSYQWALSASGTSEYYLQTSTGGDPEIPFTADVIENSALMTEGSLGSLSAGEWNYGDNDSLGYRTYYVRLSDSTDPDTKADAYIEIRGYLACLNQAGSGNIINLTISNCRASNRNSFAYLKRCQRVNINNCLAVTPDADSTVIFADSTVRNMVIKNLSYSPGSRFSTTGLISQKIQGADGVFEIYDTNQPAFSSSSTHKFNQPFLFPQSSTSATAGVTDMIQWSSCQVVNDTALMSILIPSAVQGFGIAQAADTTGGDRASAIFSFDDSVANGTATILAQNNATNTVSTANSLNIYGSGNTLRFQNNLGAQTKISVTIWYSSSALS